MPVAATTVGAHRLFLEGAVALAACEAAGFRIDVPYLDAKIAETEAKIARGKAVLRADPVYTRWRKVYGDKANLDSRAQLSHILFKDMGYPAPRGTVTGRAAADEAALSTVDLPFVRNYLKVAGLEKALGTYLKGIRRETIDGYMHPVFNLHLVVTFRSSGSDPNIQNMPVRDKGIGELIRRAFIPRPGQVFVEIDYATIEVRIAGCYTKDPALIDDVLHGDMHKDMAAKCYLLPKSAVTKAIRQTAKGGFVFAEFYGDWYKQVAKNLWSIVDTEKLADGTTLRDHLAGQGITGLGACDPKQSAAPGTFEAHIQKVEDYFWNDRYKIYGAWKRQWYADYQANGGFDTLTGFRVNGVYTRNEVNNSPIQGSAFHCLLWSLIKLQKWLRKNKMRSVIMGQIHDSMLLDCPEDELAAVTAQARHIMTVAIREAWPWIVTPLAVEIEGSRENWWCKGSLETAV